MPELDTALGEAEALEVWIPIPGPVEVLEVEVVEEGKLPLHRTYFQAYPLLQ